MFHVEEQSSTPLLKSEREKMRNYFSRADFDTIEGLIDTCLEESAVVPVEYNGATYYLYTVDADSLFLVDPKAAYFPTSHEGTVTFSPDFVTAVLPYQAQNILKQLLNPKKVTVFFAERSDGSVTLVLDRKEVYNEGFTCRFYFYNEDHYEIEPDDAIINETVAETLIDSLKTMRDEMVVVLENNTNMAEERRAAMQMWWKQNGNRLYNAAVVQHPEGDVEILSRMEAVLRGIADVVTEE